MNFHEIKINKKFKLFILALCLFLSIFALMYSSHRIMNIIKNKSENKDKLPSKDTGIEVAKPIVPIRKITKIAFEKNNNVYLYDEINEQIKSLGENSKSKDLLKLSPDKTKIVFRYFNQEKATYPPHIIVYDIKTESLTEIIIDNKNVQQIIELRWVDDDNILVTGHINPSVSGYAVYNIKSKAELISCVGTLRDVTLDKKNILYSNTPHIFPQPKANLYFNGNKIFESDNSNEEIYDGVISKDAKTIAFRSSVEDKLNSNVEVKAYINIADINSDRASISNFKKISISSDTSGEMKFDDENNIIIVGEEFIYKLKEGNLIKTENSLPKEPELTEQQLIKFKQVLAKQFPSEGISQQTLLEDIDIYDKEVF